MDEDASRGKTIRQGVAFELKPLDQPVEILVGEVEKIKNPRSGKQMTAMIENKFKPTPMLDYGLFSASRSVSIPRAYIFRNEDGMKPVIDKLHAHGIAVEELTEPLTDEVESFLIDDVKRSTRAFQGHSEVKLKGRVQKERVSFPAGSIIIRTSQPLAPLIFYLLEAESDDGFVNWNFLDAHLEKGKTYPIYRSIEELKTASRFVEDEERSRNKRK